MYPRQSTTICTIIRLIYCYFPIAGGSAFEEYFFGQLIGINVPWVGGCLVKKRRFLRNEVESETKFLYVAKRQRITHLQAHARTFAKVAQMSVLVWQAYGEQHSKRTINEHRKTMGGEVEARDSIAKSKRIHQARSSTFHWLKTNNLRGGNQKNTYAKNGKWYLG